MPLIDSYRKLRPENLQLLKRVREDSEFDMEMMVELMLYMLGEHPEFPDQLQSSARARILMYAEECGVDMDELKN